MTNPVLDALLSRRSILAKDMTGPGPNKAELGQILSAAHRVPDHGKIGPWRFIVFEGEARTQFSDALAQIFQRENPECSDAMLNFEKQRFNRAPVVIAVISAPVEHKVPEWEQVLCSGACCQNILHAAHSLGFGAQWLTEWYAYNDDVNHLLNMSDKEKIAGFIYIGQHENPPKERVRPSLDERVTYWA